MEFDALQPPQITNPAGEPNPASPNAPWTTPLNPVGGGSPGQIPQLPIPPGGGGRMEPGGVGASNAGAATLPNDLIGDIPPPPIPPPPISGPGVGGIAGTEAGTFSRPGSRGVLPLHTAAFTNKRPQRFGPGTPTVGASPEAGIGISPDDAAEILRRLAGGVQG